MSHIPFEKLLYDCVRRFPRDVRWALSCGSALTLHGLDYDPSDLDFFASGEDAYRLAAELRDLPVVFPLAWRPSGIFASHFGRFRMEDVEIDVVGDFCVRRGGRTYLWDACHPCWQRLQDIPVRDLVVPVFSLEDLVLVYLALPDEEAKLAKICSALQVHGCDRTYLRELIGPGLLEEAGLQYLAAE